MSEFLLFIIVLVGVILKVTSGLGHLEICAKCNIFKPKPLNDATIKDYFECCVTMCLELCAVKKLCAADVEKIIFWNNPRVENQTLPHYTSPTGLLH